MTARYRSFGQVVRSAREAQAWSQEVLAEKADLNRSYLGEIERGDVVPSLHTMAKVSVALGLNLSELIARCEVGSPA
ncbi:HTH-type transcriptional regulator SutR [Andreprevotia sp. IGB-42]|uniref:helix-turn-helix domain-containing protein n=1 Tax=Andreprevotia sp. IGB-42 TaxID=2497473 RepID=UPI00135C87B3|nr:helix-turn-helix transcriptional regulator [Andreprevotia sp. IGB-42]KAF0815308.1 HTH-type transcriptional regulator SutR [Andreprevotia sp. IGB-42]